jgi:hypothetical protein
MRGGHASGETERTRAYSQVSGDCQVAPGSSCVEILAAILRNINKAWDAQLRRSYEAARQGRLLDRVIERYKDWLIC